jgi:hypothetical protein
VRIVSYEAKLTWQETVTQNISKEVNDNLYLYIGLPFAITGIAFLITGFFTKYAKDYHSSIGN